MCIPVTLLRFIWLSSFLVNKMCTAELPAEIKLKEHSVTILFSKHWQGRAMAWSHMKRICSLQAETRTQIVWLQSCLLLTHCFFYFCFDLGEPQPWLQTKQPNNKNSFSNKGRKVFKLMFSCLNLFTLNSLICNYWNVYFCVIITAITSCCIVKEGRIASFLF